MSKEKKKKKERKAQSVSLCLSSRGHTRRRRRRRKVVASMGRRIWPSALRLLREHARGSTRPREAQTALEEALWTSLSRVDSEKSSGGRKVVAKEDVLTFLSRNNNDAIEGRPIETYAFRSDGTKDASTSKSDGPPKSTLEKKKVVVVNAEFEDVPNGAIRKVIASRLAASKHAQPHSYVTMDVDASGVDRFRKKSMQDHEKKVSVNDCIVYAASKALRRVGKVNSRYDAKVGKRVEFDTVDISVAMAAPSGLVTPIVFNADNKSVSEIGQDVRRLAGKAKEGKLKPSEMMGGSFTISNLGMFSVDSFQAIQNPPQGAILAVGRGTERVIVSESARGSMKDEDDEDEAATPGALFSEDQLTTRLSISATLSIDNRCMDEADASEWLEAFADEMRNADDFVL